MREFLKYFLHLEALLLNIGLFFGLVVLLLEADLICGLRVPVKGTGLGVVVLVHSLLLESVDLVRLLFEFFRFRI